MAPTRKHSSSGKRSKSKSKSASKKASSSRHDSSSSSGKKSKRARDAAHGAAGATKLYGPTDLILVLGDGGAFASNDMAALVVSTSIASALAYITCICCCCCYMTTTSTDFTFSRGLVKHRGTGDGLLATSFDSETTVRSKYANAHQCINDIRSLQGRVLHDVDATQLDDLPLRLKDGAYVPTFFQYIIFNFPHSGQQRVHVNRVLLRNFFVSARSRLFKHGEVHVTLKTKPPYSNWLIEEQARDADLVLKERRPFDIKLFPGYHHRTTDPTAKAFEPDQCITYVFIVNRAKHPFEAIAQAATEAAHRRKLGDDAAPLPPAAATNTAIAQLLEAHARAKAKAQATPLASQSSTGRVTTTAGPSKSKMTSAIAQDAPKTQLKREQLKQKQQRLAQFWTPLHRHSLVRLPAAPMQS